MDQLFDIQKFSSEDAAKLDATPNEPHQHEWEELLVGLEGELDHFICALRVSALNLRSLGASRTIAV